MPYEYLPELATADIAFHAWGKNVEEVFVSASDAMMNIMIENPQAIEPQKHRNIRLENDALDMLLFEFLQEMIYYKDSEQLLLRIKNIQLTKNDGKYVLRSEAAGEPLDPMRHQQRVDVKAVTLHQFRVDQTDSGWEATVVLDI